jgi:hypothetical protein
VADSYSLSSEAAFYYINEKVHYERLAPLFSQGLPQLWEHGRDKPQQLFGELMSTRNASRDCICIYHDDTRIQIINCGAGGRYIWPPGVSTGAQYGARVVWCSPLASEIYIYIRVQADWGVGGKESSVSCWKTYFLVCGPHAFLMFRRTLEKKCVSLPSVLNIERKYARILRTCIWVEEEARSNMRRKYYYYCCFRAWWYHADLNLPSALHERRSVQFRSSLAIGIITHRKRCLDPRFHLSAHHLHHSIYAYQPKFQRITGQGENKTRKRTYRLAAETSISQR